MDTSLTISSKASKRTKMAFDMLEAMGINDEEHRRYLAEECDQLDMMNAWSDLMDGVKTERKSVNPDNLMTCYLFGLSTCDPTSRRVIAYDPDGILESNYPSFRIVFSDDSENVVHQRSSVVVEVKAPFSWREQTGDLHEVFPGVQPLPVEALRPGMIVLRRGVPSTIFMIVPAKMSPVPLESGSTSDWMGGGGRRWATFNDKEKAEKFAKDLKKKGMASFCEESSGGWVAGFVGEHSNSYREVACEDDAYEDCQGIPLAPLMGKHLWWDTHEFPDIDVDYSPEILPLIIPWAAKRFGEDKVAGVATYQRLGFLSSLKDIGRVFDVPLVDLMRISEAISPDIQKLKRTDKDFDRLWQEYVDATPELVEFLNTPGEKGEKHRLMLQTMKGLQGKTKTFSQHASAVIISKESLDGAVPMVARAGVKLSAWAEGQDRSDLSKLGHVKFDRLGLQTLFNRDACMQMLYARGQLSKTIGLFRRSRPDWVKDRADDWMFADWTDDAYLENEESLAAAARGETIGCFQFESPGIRQMLRDIAPTFFEEIVAANAMYRPGVLKAKIDGIDGGDKAFVARKRGDVHYSIPEPLKKDLSGTYGLMIYQEQVMKVLEIAGGVPSTDCEMARKAISKKKLEVLGKYRRMFVRSAKKTVGWNEETASKYFDDNIVTWSGYGFNRCIEPSSLVTMSDGRAVPAQDVVPGDLVLAYDPGSNSFFHDEVVGIHDNGTKDLFEVTLSDGKQIRCTMDHDLMCEDGVKRKLFEVISGEHHVVVVEERPS